MPTYVRGRGSRSLTDAEIIQAYVQGEDADSIGIRAGCSGTTVRDLVRAAGEVVRGRGKRPRKPLKLTDAEILRLYRSGQSGQAVADAAGTTTNTVYKIVRDQGGTIRPAQRSKREYVASQLERCAKGGHATAAARRERKAEQDG
jgi:DNA-binding CsgD family transcriptional regulator